MQQAPRAPRLREKEPYYMARLMAQSWRNSLEGGMLSVSTNTPRSHMNTAMSSFSEELTDPPRTSPDLDVRDLEQRTRLMRALARLVAVSELGSKEIAKQADVSKQKVSDLLAGRIEQLSLKELKKLRLALEPEQMLS
jgi:predicted XRE-type DNA-binding protein